MDHFLNVSSSPHVRAKTRTPSIMYDVALALLPASAFGVYHFGLYSLAVIAVCVVMAMLTEYAFQRLARQPITVWDGSALVTGLLLALNLPPTIPLWIGALGSVFAILFVKQLFGGLGQNFMNPALGARCFLMISFAGRMTDFSVDGVSGATPLAVLKAGGQVDLSNMYWGFIPGTIGEVSVVALLIGAIYLLLRGVITLRIPATYIVTFVVFLILFGGHGVDPKFIAAHLCGGGLMLGAFYMATDYVTSPLTPNGQILFGVLLGVLTGVFRLFGPTAEGVSYAIIISNLLVPLMEKVTIPEAFGWEKKKLNFSRPVKVTVATLCCITLAAGLGLGAVYQVTKEPIAEQELAALRQSYLVVCPDASGFETPDDLAQRLANAQAEDPFGHGDLGRVSIDDALVAVDEAGNTVGYVVCASSRDGYNGLISMTIGLSAEGSITGISFLTLAETPSLGMVADEDWFKDQYKGIGPEAATLVGATAPTGEGQVNAISGATITSAAVTNAVNAALLFIEGYIK